MGGGVFARLSRRQARWVLALTAVGIVACVFVTLSPLAQGFADRPRTGPNDISLYLAEVQRIHGGESYYAVAADELPARGYPTRSVFNWRTPLPMWLIGMLPDPVLGKALLGALAVAAMLLAFEFSAREGGRLQTVLGLLLLSGGLLPCFLGDLYVMPVLWAGALITLSVCALGIGRWKLGVAAGILAVFCRDLAGPYCVIGLAAALWRLRIREAAWWTAGLAAYGAFFLWHCTQVDAWRTADAVSHTGGWVQFGGLAFVLSTVQMNGYLLVLPQWFSGIYLPLSLLGFSGWSTGAGRFAGVSALAYLALFSVVGLDINQYWGSLYAPLLCLGASRAPHAIAELWRAAQLPMAGTTSQPAAAMD